MCVVSRYIVFEYCCSTLEALLDVAEKPAVASPGHGRTNSWASRLPFVAVARPQIGMARALKIGFELSLAVRRPGAAGPQLLVWPAVASVARRHVLAGCSEVACVHGRAPLG